METQVTLNSGSVDSAGSLLLRTNGTTTAVTVDASQNVGVGVTPSSWATVVPAMQIGTGGAFVAAQGSASTVRIGANAYYNGGWKYTTTAAASVYQQLDGSHIWTAAASGTAGNAITFNTNMTLDASSNLGLGVTPSTTTAKHIQGPASFFIGPQGDGLYLMSNAYYNSGFKYATTDVASYYSQSAGQHRWYNAASGTAGNAITFTQAMTLDASGNLLVGATSGSSERLYVTNAPATSTRTAQISNLGNTSGNQCFGLALGSNTNNASSYFLVANGAGSDRLYIFGTGSVQNSTGSYGTISDAKLKENIVDATPKLADVMRLQVRNYNLKTDPDLKQIGFVAQELEQVFPAMIDETPDRDADGNETGEFTKAIKTSILIPILVKALQEQQALITQLQADVAALKGA